MISSSFNDFQKISESYSDFIFLTESTVLDDWNRDHRELRTKIIQNEKKADISLKYRYDWEIDEKELPEIGIHDDGGYKLVGSGAGRDVYQTPFGTVLKIAMDSAGIAQNIEEYNDKTFKNRLGCFPFLIWKSPKGTVIEVESVDGFGYDDDRFYEGFEHLNGMSFNDYCNMVENELEYASSDNMRGYAKDTTVNPYFIKEQLKHPKNESQRLLAIFTNYLFSKRDKKLMIEVLRSDNWGFAFRNGEMVIIPVDMGANERIMSRYY